MPKSKSTLSSNRDKRKDAPYDKDRRVKEHDITPPCHLVEQAMLSAPSSSDTTTVLVLPNGPLVLCFEFVGPGNYRFIAGTCRRFLKQYLKVERQKRTFWKNAALCVPRAELCLSDNLILVRMERQEVLTRLAFEATYRGRLQLVQWAHGHGLDLTTATTQDLSIMDIAVGRHHIPVLEYLHQVGCEFTTWHCRLAVQFGNLPTLRFLYEHGGCDLDARAFDTAARMGNLDIIKYLHANGCERNEENALLHAASRGHLDVLRYLFEDASFDLATHGVFCSSSAVRGGHLEILQYMDQKRAINHELNCLAASTFGQLEVLQYSVENCSSEWNDSDGILAQHCLRAAAGRGHDHIVQWIRENS